MDEIEVQFFYELNSPPTPAVFRPAEIRAAFGAADVACLGTGTFGETWRVGSGANERAMKVIHRADYPVLRLRREIEGLHRGACANVVRLISVTTVTLRRTPHPVLEFEYVPGGDSQSAIAAGKWPIVTQVREFGRAVATGLDALHSHETVHRDIKFLNVALRGGRWRDAVILDLGLARTLDEATMTQYPRMMGTRAFMAPEQVRGEPAKKAADLWALGVMLFILMTHEHPFYGDRAASLNRLEAIDRLEAGPPPWPAGLNAQMGPLITRLLEPKQFRRGTAARAVEDLT